jgi:hypothetical protein
MRWRYPLLSGVDGCGDGAATGVVTMVAIGVITGGDGNVAGA